ncbi:MAG: type II secretion system protein, partial [Burkholderiales bacterium]|nr:type II secretion system protein [Phycisphaerae bacterium]
MSALPYTFYPLPSRRSAFTLIEMLTTVAILIIVLGLMVSLAREVRYRSAEVLTKELLTHLDELTQSFKQRKGRLPNLEMLLPANVTQADANEAKVRAAARLNNEALVNELKGEIVRSGLLQHDRTKGGGFCDLPISLYDGRLLADAWGNPIVFMPNQHPVIGMAPIRSGEEEQAFFFFSPGPDGRYL